MATRFREYLRPPRKLRFTRDGRWFVGMTIMVGFGAVNTGNNLLYLLLGMMLGLILVSGVLSERVLRGIEVLRLPTGDLFAGSANRIGFEVRNRKRRFASYSISVQEHESRETRRRRRVAQGLPASPPSRRKDREAEADVGGPKALALRIAPATTTVVTGQYEFPIRGVYRFAGIDVATRFPFGFFEKIRPFRDEHELLVYPAIRVGVFGQVDADRREGEVAQQSEGRMGEFFGLREYRDGDDMRDVHWKVSARRNKLIRRLYDRRDNEAVALHLYNYAPPIDDRATELAILDELEEAIVIVASIAAELSANGHRFSLHTIGETVSEGAGAGQLQAVLRHLALLEIRRDPQPPRLALSVLPNRLLIPSSLTPSTIRHSFDAVFDAAGRAA